MKKPDLMKQALNILKKYREKTTKQDKFDEEPCCSGNHK